MIYDRRDTLPPYFAEFITITDINNVMKFDFNTGTCVKMLVAHRKRPKLCQKL